MAGIGGTGDGSSAYEKAMAERARDTAAAEAAAAQPPPAPVYSAGAPASLASPSPTSSRVAPSNITGLTGAIRDSSLAAAPSQALSPRITPNPGGGADSGGSYVGFKPPTAAVAPGVGGSVVNGVYQIAPTSVSTSPTAVPLPQGHLKQSSGSSFESDRQGLAYQLGGNAEFTGQLTAAIQTSAAANAANLAGVGNAAANVGAQSQQSLGAIGSTAQRYGETAAADVTGDANLLGHTGVLLNQQGAAVQGREAPGLNAGAQDNALAQAQLQVDALGQAGANAYTTAASAQGRAAPTLDVAQQNAALAASGKGATALQGLGSQAQQLGLAADGREAPQAQLAGANAAIQAAQGNAGNVGNVGNQALALSQDASGRAAIAPANYGLSQAMLGQGVNSSVGAQQTGQALTGLEATQGPSAAQAQLAQSQAMAAAQAMSLARSGRGWGGSAQGLADAQRAQAAGLMTANNQAAQLSAQENASWRQRQAANLASGAQISNQSGALQLQAGTQLGQQAQADQAAALQSQAQNDQLQSQMYGYGLQGAQAAGQLNTAAGQQLSQNAIQQAQIDQQATAQNDARLGQMTALGMQGQQEAAALQQAQAAQYGQQASQNQQAALQSQAQNDAYSGQMYGLGLQGQQQAAALTQATAAQYGEQAAQIQQAQLQQNQLNDQYSTNLYNTGTSALQNATQAKLNAGQLGLSGIQANGEMSSAGANNALAGLSQQQQAATTASQIDQNALMQTGQLAQVQSQLRQNQVGDWLQERGINEGLTTAERGQTMQMVGAGLTAVGTAAAFMSDVRAKENIMPDLKPPTRKSYAELKAELSEGDSLLNPKPAEGGKKPFTLQDAEAEYALAAPGNYNTNRVSPGRGTAVMGPGGPEYDKAMDAASKAKAGEGKTLGAATSALQSFGNAMQNMPGTQPNFSQPSRPRFGLQPLQLTSDVRSKTDVKGDGPSASKRADLEEMRRAIAGLGEQAGSNMPERFAPPSGEILESAKATPSFSYDYKDPAAVGAAPGRQYGPMAQSLAQQPATASLVRPGPDGKLSVDGARLGATAYSGLGQLARKQESDYADLRKRIAGLGAA
jgi:hypothetical protein